MSPEFYAESTFYDSLIQLNLSTSGLSVIYSLLTVMKIFKHWIISDKDTLFYQHNHQFITRMFPLMGIVDKSSPSPKSTPNLARLRKKKKKKGREKKNLCCSENLCPASRLSQSNH
jgi:hypothetical protein